MKKLLAAIFVGLFALAGYAATADAAPNVIMKSWDWSADRAPRPLETSENGGFPAGSKVIISFVASYKAVGGLSAAPFPPGATEHGCTTETSISSTPGDFDPKTSVRTMTGPNQGISFATFDQYGGRTVPIKLADGTKITRPLVAVLEVGKTYYLNFRALGAGCGDFRLQYNTYPVK